MRCDTCHSAAVIDLPYRGAHLCEQHFTNSVRDRVRRELHRQLPGFPGGTVAVALSGGKDSAVALALCRSYFEKRPNLRLIALTVDEGIAGYRSATIQAAQTLARQLNIEHKIVRARELLGTTTDQAAVQLAAEAPCSFCGVWRRQLLNRTARDLGASVLVLGFNLDDLAQTVLMNLARGDVERVGRMAPHRRRRTGLIPRLAPLAMIPEREVYLFARLSGLPFDHGECPHAHRAARNVYREVVWRLEEEIPGTRHALLRSRERIADLLDLRGEMSSPDRCSVCGDPTNAGVCRACEYLDLAKKAIIPESG